MPLERTPAESHVFLSHASIDRDRATNVARVLTESGVAVWIDQVDIPGGVSWSGAIVRGIRSCAAFVLLFSKASMVSANVQRELQLALDNERPILPLVLEPAETPDAIAYALAGVQRVHIGKRPEREWVPEALRALAVLGSGGHTLAEPRSTAAERSDAFSKNVRANKRIRIAIGPSLSQQDDQSLELATSVARYVSWDGGPFATVPWDKNDESVGKYQNIDYLVQITVQQSEEQFRSTWRVQWSETGDIIWANHHAELKSEFFRKSHRIAEMIGEGVLRSITDHELRRIAASRISELSYGQLVLKADQFSGMNRERIAERCDLLRQAIALEPATGLAHATLADLLSWKLMNGISHDAADDAVIARREAAKAFELEPNDPSVLLSVGQTYCRIGEYERGLAFIRRSNDLAPTVRAKEELAMGLCFAGKPEDAIPLFEDMLATMPSGHTFRYGRLAVALTQAGRLEEALTFSNEYVIHFPDDFYGWVMHANLLVQLKREEDGRRAITEALRIMPNMELDRVIARTEATYGRSDEQIQHLTSGLRTLVAGR